MDRKNISQTLFFNRIYDISYNIYYRILISFLFGIICFICIFCFIIGIHSLISVFCYYFYSYLYLNSNSFMLKTFHFIGNNYESYKKTMDKIGSKVSFIFYISLFLSMCCFIFSTWFFNKIDKKIGDGIEKRGADFLSTKEFKKKIKKASKSKKMFLSFSKNDLIIGEEKIQIPRSLGASMWAFMGQSGTGKSQAIRHFLKQIRVFEDKVMIVDPLGEYYQYFGRKEDVILSLYDVRSEIYSFWDEPISKQQIASVLIEDLAQGRGNLFWSQAGQLLMADLLSLHKTEIEIYDALLKNPAALQAKLVEYSMMSGSVLGGKEMGSGVMGSTGISMGWLKYMNVWPKMLGKTEAFSIKRWVNDNEDKRWVFLTSSRDHFQDSRHLIRLWTDLVCSCALNRGSVGEHRPIWLVCDELAAIGRLPSLASALNEGRKFKLGVITGCQSISQLRDIYGKDEADSILQGLQNQVLFRSKNNDMKEYVSEQLGGVEKTKVVSSQSFGNHASDSISYQTVYRRNVLPDEVPELFDLHAYLKVPIFGPTKIVIPPISLPIVQEAHASYIPGSEENPWNGYVGRVQLIDFAKVSVDFSPYRAKKSVEPLLVQAKPAKRIENDVQNDVQNDAQNDAQNVAINSVLNHSNDELSESETTKSDTVNQDQNTVHASGFDLSKISIDK